MTDPFKLVNKGESLYDVIDRASDEKIGSVALWYHGWSATLASEPGVPILSVSEGTVRGHVQRRTDAAWLVWIRSRAS